MKNNITLIRKSKIINISKKQIDEIVNKSLNFVNRKGCLSIVLSEDRFIQKYNKEFRGKDKPTNVLSFSSDSNELEDEDYLGDIIISLETIQKEAIEQQKTEINHFTHILIHGVLHLCGFDHIEEKDREKMEGIEIEILKLFGIENPYII